MFKIIRIGILLFVLFFVSVSAWLTKARSTDWNNTLWVKVYPINGDGSDESSRYIEGLRESDFSDIEDFIAREVHRFGHDLDRPLRLQLGREIREQPPALGERPALPQIIWWSLKLRWWASRIASNQDDPAPDVRIFVRYHSPRSDFVLENSVGMQKGMVGIVNAFADRRHAGSNNVVIAHEFLHTLGSIDKYEAGSGLPLYPQGYAEPDRKPRYPQQFAEIMGGRIPLDELDAVIPKNLKHVLIGAETAAEIQLLDQ
jgi:hypothetical protein